MNAPAVQASRRIVDTLVIHCSATPNGDGLFRFARGDRVARQTAATVIDAMHASRGFRRSPEWRRRQNPTLVSIGYHFVIACNGALFTGRHLDEIGAHAKGHNARSLGICLTGTDAYTLEQWAKLAAVVASLERSYPGVNVVGHRDLSPDLDGDGLIEPHEYLKTCPGFDVATWRAGGMAPLPAHLTERKNP